MSGEVLLSCDSLERRHGERTLFSGLSFGVFEGDRIGLVGPNGSGKTTLLCILAGLEEADGGSVTRSRHLSIGFVPQVPDLDPDLTAREAAAQALSELDLPPHELWPRAEAALSRAGLASSPQLVGTLSGGWRKRLAIAGQLAREPDLLLLDEPTNHLDLEGILWLEALLVDQRRTCVVVSHDRRLLENVSTRILELSRVWPSGIFGSEGGYEAFLERREQALEAQASDQASLANVVRRELAWLRRGPKARTTKSRARIQEATRLGEELDRAKERSATGTAGLDFSATGRKSKRLLTAEGVGLSLGGRPIVSGLNLSLVNGTRLGLIGPNGSGKTTLLRLLAGELRPDEGRIERAPGLAVVRFEQDRESLDPALSLKAALAPTGDTVIFRDRPIHVSGWARRFLFRNEQLSLPVGRLSGGEQARVLLARLMLQPADLLLLDEPTNDLDIDTLEVLEESLIDFPGSLVLVTHDRQLLDRVATTLLSIEAGGRVESHADLAQWEAFRRAAMKGDRDAASRPTGAGERSTGQRGRSEAKGLKRLSYLERQEWAAMEERILEAEARAESCRAAASDPAIATDAATLAARHAELDVAEGEVERLYARWAELEARQG